MPEGSITKEKIRDHFRRLWMIYLAGVVIVLFLNNLIFTVTRPSFSDEEILKIMLLNTEVEMDTDSLLASLAETGILSVQTEILPGANIADPASVMLVSVKLTSGYGDIYLTDSAGLEVLESRAACLDLSGMEMSDVQFVQVIHPETNAAYPGALQTGNGLLLVIPSNAENAAAAQAALPILVKQITE